MEIVLMVLPVLGYAFATAWVAVLIHEAGHYLAGLAVGLPARAMRIRLKPSPPHVALRDGEQWLAPDDRGYIAAFTQHRDSSVAAWVFIAGGFVVETAAMLALAFATQGMGGVAAIVLITSTAILLLYLAADGLAFLRSGEPSGDAGAMWQISRAGTIGLLVVLLGVRGAALALVW